MVVNGTASQLTLDGSGHYSATYYNAENCFVLTSGDFTLPETIHDTIQKHDTIYIPGEYIANEVQWIEALHHHCKTRSLRRKRELLDN